MDAPLVDVSDVLEHHTRVAMLPSIVATLSAHDEEAVSNALGQLASLMDTLYGEHAEAFCEYLRVSGAVEHCCDLCANHPAPEVHQQTLMLLGNLASDAVDPQASLTKALIRRHGTFDVMAASLFSSDWTTLVYALGAVQNVGHELQYALRDTRSTPEEGIPVALSPIDRPDASHAPAGHLTDPER